MAMRIKAACQRLHVTAVPISYYYTSRLGLLVDVTALSRCDCLVQYDLEDHGEMAYVYVEQHSRSGIAHCSGVAWASLRTS